MFPHVSTINDRLDLYFIDLNKEWDWNIEEIIVLNNFYNRPILMNLVKELNLGKLAHRLLFQDWQVTGKWENKRGNFQLNHGFNHMDINNREKMNELTWHNIMLNQGN